MRREQELLGVLQTMVATARARRIREAWAAAAARLALEHTIAARLFDDVLEGSPGGVHVEVRHLAVHGLKRLSTVIEAEPRLAPTRSADLGGEAVRSAYEAAVAAGRSRAPLCSVYRTIAPPSDESPPLRLFDHGAAIGLAIRRGRLVLQHAGPIDDAALLEELIREVVLVAETIASDAHSDHMGGTSESA